VYEDTRPSSQSTNRMTTIVQSMVSIPCGMRGKRTTPD
jgi:hypothetical protein